MIRCKNNLVIGLLTVTLIAFNFINPISTSFAQDLIRKEVVQEFSKEVDCLAENIYYESAGESYEGKLAVAQVTINRVKSGKFASNICGVVRQKNTINGSMVCQFSWVCNSVKNMVRNKYQWEESLLVARKSLTQSVAHDLISEQDAMYYHAVYVNPGWKLKRVTQIGNHIFYK
jgi:spore germination cell wall hydrolase CwlJ-like protein